jgi:hypothetical protein
MKQGKEEEVFNTFTPKNSNPSLPTSSASLCTIQVVCGISLHI